MPPDPLKKHPTAEEAFAHAKRSASFHGIAHDQSVRQLLDSEATEPVLLEAAGLADAAVDRAANDVRAKSDQLRYSVDELQRLKKAANRLRSARIIRFTEQLYNSDTDMTNSALASASEQEARAVDLVGQPLGSE